MTSRELIDRYSIDHTHPGLAAYNAMVRGCARQYDQVSELAEWCVNESLESGADTEEVWQAIVTARELQDRMRIDFFEPTSAAIRDGLGWGSEGVETP